MSLKMIKLLRFSIPVVIAFLLSIVMTLVNYGLTDAFLVNWLKAFVIAMIIVPLGIRVIPFIAAGVRKLAGGLPPLAVRCIVAVCVAAMMEIIVAFAVTMVQRGFADGWALIWAMTFLKALPMGLVIGFSMTFLVHPWLQRLALKSQSLQGA